MHKAWLKRIERLEAMTRLGAPKHAVFRYGYVRRLATDSNSERHVAITNTKLTSLANVEHCEFEERMGPQPGPIPDLSFTVHLKMAETHDSAPSP
jgi:hypothetical protein